MKSMTYSFAYIPGFVALVALLLGGWWTWAVPAFIFLCIPSLETVWSGTRENLGPDQLRIRRDQRRFDAMVYGIVPLQLGAVVLLVVQVSRGAFAGWELGGAIFSVGLCCGAYGLNVGHELGHRAGRVGRWTALLLMATSLYPHFLLQHTRGHHKHVATEEDPASAGRGEWIYAFWMRSISGGLADAWCIDRGHVARVWSATLAVLVFVALAAGPAAAAAWVGAGAIGILLLETVNYVEHYGLRRARLKDGRYERTRPCHSWNANNPLGRALLFDLTRHSDHHASPGRHYQVLRCFEDSPQLPTGYPGMILLALVPPLFHAVMHPHIDRESARLGGLSVA